MTHRILTDVAASISELKANPTKVVASGEGMPIAGTDPSQLQGQAYDLSTYRSEIIAAVDFVLSGI